MRVLVWQWGRRGAMPHFAAALAEGFEALPGVTALLSLAAGAEIVTGAAPPCCDLPVATYRGMAGCLLRLAALPWLIWRLHRALCDLRPDVAICVHAGPLDPAMALALQLHGVPMFVIVHEAVAHEGDRRATMLVQRMLLALSQGAVVLSAHVGAALRTQGYGGPILQGWHPPLRFGEPPPPPRAHGGRLRVLFFGRLLAYKGLDLLAETAAMLAAHEDVALRVVGQGAPMPALDRLSALPWVEVENRWVPEAEIGALLAWADVLVLPYRAASQSGVAAAALAAGRYVVATRVAGLAEQLGDEPLALLCDPSAQSLAAAIAVLTGHRPAAADVTGRDWSALAARLLADIAPPSRPPSRPAGASCRAVGS